MAGRFIGLTALVWAAASVQLTGRVGETQQQLEGHLLADGAAQRMSPADAAALHGAGRRGFGRGFPPATHTSGGGFDIVSSIDSLLWQAIGQSPPAPDSNGVQRQPPDFNEYIYFKTDDGSPVGKKLDDPSSITGWELRVYHYKQLSALEIYHRHGAGLLDPEIEALLGANRGNSSWARKHGDSSRTLLLSDDSGDASFIGYDYERGDGQARALRVDNDLVIFSTDFDKKLLEVKKGLAKTPDGRIPNSALTSTHGF